MKSFSGMRVSSNAKGQIKTKRKGRRLFLKMRL